MPRHDAGLGGAVHAPAESRSCSICAPTRTSGRITSNTYWEWYIRHVYFMYGAQAVGAQFAATFKEFPPIQKPNTFTLDDALKMMHETASGMH